MVIGHWYKTLAAHTGRVRGQAEATLRLASSSLRWVLYAVAAWLPCGRTAALPAGHNVGTPRAVPGDLSGHQRDASRAQMRQAPNHPIGGTRAVARSMVQYHAMYRASQSFGRRVVGCV